MVPLPFCMVQEVVSFLRLVSEDKDPWLAMREPQTFTQVFWGGVGTGGGRQVDAERADGGVSFQEHK